MQLRAQELLGPTAQAMRPMSTILDPRGIGIPWGPEGTLELALPSTGLFSSANVNIISPDVNSPLVDYAQALEAALDSPICDRKLSEAVGPGTKIAVVVDDPSRWTPVREALPIVLQRLTTAGVRPEDITISVGVGRHHAVSATAMRNRIGDSIAEHYRCFSPPIDDLSAYVDLGHTSQNVPVRIFRPVAEADLRILIGSVLPHLQAGFGGGYKLIFPGTSHRSTLGALHRQGLSGKTSPSKLLGSNAADNPMRQAIREAANRIGLCWSISHLIGGPSQVFQVVAGDPARVQDLLALEVERRFHAPTLASADMVMVGNYPWPGDPMQSFKVILQHRAACQPGGVLVGLFWTELEEIDRSFPLATLRGIGATGIVGGWIIRQLLPLARRIAGATRSPAEFMLKWACELVVDRTVLVYSPPLYERLGSHLGPIRLFGDQGVMWQAAVKAVAGVNNPERPLEIRVFPQGGLTYATERQSESV
jgi:nickel-dependent lactate racemase